MYNITYISNILRKYNIYKIILFVLTFYSQSLSQTIYYPLQIGNYWEYTNEYFLDSKFRIEVIDTLSINDKLYYQVTNTQSNSNSLLRYDQSGILYSYSISNNTETLSIDFSMNVGDTLTFWYPDSIYFYYLILLSDTSTVHTPIRTFNNCFEYLKDEPDVWDDEYWYYYAPNIGMVLVWTWLTQAYFLTAARIDGEELSIKTLIVLKEFNIFNSYPNPFNPTTNIQYELPQRSEVQILIYDLLGRKVTTLVSETQEAGFKSVIWNATNDHGKPVSAGVYLYQIRAGEFVGTKKMVLLK